MSQKMSGIFIGASAGGITAVQNLLPLIISQNHLPIVIVQHLPQYADIKLPLVYGSPVESTLVEVSDKTPIERGHVYFAPPGYHLLIERQRFFSLSQDEMVNFARPSIDVFFESAAYAYGPEACGVLLTGANNDGAKGLQTIQKYNGTTIVQDPSSAEFPTMPQSALNLIKPNHVCSIPMISKILSAIIRGETP